MWDLKNTMLFICSIIIVILISMKMANATETGKSKAEWNALYAEAGCMDLNFFQREVCKTKVFQKTNWTESKYQLKGFFEKLDLN